MAGLGEDDDVSDDQLVSKHSNELARAMRAARAPAAEEEVEAEEPPEPDDDDEAEEAAAVAPSRSEKRAARVTSRERAAAAEAREQVLREQLAELRNAPAREARQAPQGNPVAAIEARIRDNYARQEAAHDEWNRLQASGKMGKADQERLRNLGIDLDVEKTTLIAERRDALLAPQREAKSRMDALAARAPDVYESERALQYARGYFNQQLALGKADNMELHDEAMQVAREAVLGKRARPDAAQKQRGAGMRSGARPGGNAEAPVRISMPRGSDMDRIARAAYPKLDAAQARQKWVNENGKEYMRLQQERAARGRDD